MQNAKQTKTGTEALLQIIVAGVYKVSECNGVRLDGVLVDATPESTEDDIMASRLVAVDVIESMIDSLTLIARYEVEGSTVEGFVVDGVAISTDQMATWGYDQICERVENEQ